MIQIDVCGFFKVFDVHPCLIGGNEPNLTHIFRWVET